MRFIVQVEAKLDAGRAEAKKQVSAVGN